MSSEPEQPSRGEPAAATGAVVVPSPRDGSEALAPRLAALLPPSPALDLATVTSGLCDGPARESVARLLAG